MWPADSLLPLLVIPTWVWAALLMAAFAGISVLTMALARIPAQRTPPPIRAAHDTAAARATRALRDAEALIDKGELRGFYERLEETVRWYLVAGLRVPAGAMPPDQLERQLESLDISAPVAGIAVDLVRRCEAVRGGAEATAERARTDLSAARRMLSS